VAHNNVITLRKANTVLRKGKKMRWVICRKWRR
jgi:hypothetical protein